MFPIGCNASKVAGEKAQWEIFFLVMSTANEKLHSKSLASLSLVIIFNLKSVLSDISIATIALFWLLFAWNIFFVISISTFVYP